MKVTALFPFRNELIIFGEERIYRLTGNTIADFVLQPITRDIGCLNGFTVQELAGDIIFLGRDGLRTVAGTERINDVELGTISGNVKELFDDTDVDEFESTVIPGKTQYRLFKSVAGTLQTTTNGVIAVRKQQGFEFATTRGIKPSSTDSFTAQGETFILHGGYDGYVYRQESGNTFDGTNIIGRYRSPDMTMGDAGIRKNFQRVIINYSPKLHLIQTCFCDMTMSRPMRLDQQHIHLTVPQWWRCTEHQYMAQRHMVVSLIHL